jgi:transposase InsO family protein
MKRTNHPKKQPPEDALFRYQVLSQVLVCKHQGLTNPDAIEVVASSSHVTPAGKVRTVSKRSIYRWLADYKKNDFAGLLPAARKPIPPIALSQNLLDFFKEQKEADPRTSIPELIRRARALYLVPDDEDIDRTTVWRNLKSMGVPTKRRKQIKLQDKKRFAYPHRMDMILCDGKHFRAGITRKRRVALFFLDDATRMILGVKTGTAESAQLFLHGLYQVINTYGRMTTIFLDNGPGFIADDTINVLRKLGILLINGTVAYPEGHGKIERFNQTAQEQILRLLDKNPEVDPSCTALDLRLNHYLSNQYVHTPHEGLNKETPWSRFHNDERQLRFFENQNEIRQAFILHETRRVSADNVISFKSTNYEVPPGHAGEAITLRRNVLDATLSILHHEAIVTLAPVNLHANARDKRSISQKTEEQKQLPKSSAQISYDKEVGPIITADGGFDAPKEKL